MKKKLVAFQCLVFILLFVKSLVLFAHSDSVPAISTSAGIDLVSHYVWRSQDNEHTPGLQPELSVTWKEFTLGFWGAYRIVGPGDHEIDFYLEKSIGSATFSICDYWNYSDSTTNNYFNYSKQITAHSFEAQVLLSGAEKLPFNLLAGYFFYGYDLSKSIYIKLQYLHSFRAFNTQTFAGFQPKGEFFAPIAAVVNLGCTITKSTELTKCWSLPMSISCILNPNSEHVYLVAGITLLTI